MADNSSNKNNCEKIVKTIAGAVEALPLLIGYLIVKIFDEDHDILGEINQVSKSLLYAALFSIMLADTFQETSEEFKSKVKTKTKMDKDDGKWSNLQKGFTLGGRIGAEVIYIYLAVNASPHKKESLTLFIFSVLASFTNAIYIIGKIMAYCKLFQEGHCLDGYRNKSWVKILVKIGDFACIYVGALTQTIDDVEGFDKYLKGFYHILSMFIIGSIIIAKLCEKIQKHDEKDEKKSGWQSSFWYISKIAQISTRVMTIAALIFYLVDKKLQSITKFLICIFICFASSVMIYFYIRKIYDQRKINRNELHEELNQQDTSQNIDH